MIRYTLFVMTILGTAATAIATAQPISSESGETFPAHVTVIQKNSPFPVIGPLVVEPCILEDCSE